MKRMVPISLLVCLVQTAPATSQLGCGGCYAGGTISDLAAMPPAGCLALAAGEIDPCNGGYAITIDNNCADELALGATRVPAGATGVIDGDLVCEGSSCSLAGTLGATPTTIRWTVQPDD